MEFFAQQLFRRDFIVKNDTCPWEPSLYETAAKPIFGHTTFYTFNTVLSGLCAAISILTISILGLLHGTHFSRPSEQTKILRVTHLIPAYSVYSWISIYYPEIYYYLQPWVELLQGCCLCSFFLLLLEFVSHSENERAIFFAGIDIKDRKKDKSSRSGRHYDTPEKRLMWYRQKWVAIFQYPIVSIVVCVVTDVTEAIGRFCDSSFSPQFANLWTFLMSNISISLAITAILSSYGNLKVHLKHRHPLSKLIAFKLVVALGFIQSILFSILRSVKVMHPTEYLTYADIKVGIPTMLICIEMVPIAFFCHYAYSYKPYCIGAPQPVREADSAVPQKAEPISYKGGFLGWRAVLMTIDPRDLLRAFVFAFKMGTEMQQYRGDSKPDGYAADDFGYQSGVGFPHSGATESIPLTTAAPWLNGQQPGYSSGPWQNGQQPVYQPGYDPRYKQDQYPYYNSA